MAIINQVGAPPRRNIYAGIRHVIRPSTEMTYSMKHLISSIAMFVIVIHLISPMRCVESANFLLSPHFGHGSHFHSMVPIGRSLVARGHNVTFLVADVYEDYAREHANVRQFKFERFVSPGLRETMDEIHDGMAKASLDKRITEEIKSVNLLRLACAAACEDVMSDEGLLTRLLEYDAFVLDVVWTCGIYIKSYGMRHRGAADIPITLVAPMTPFPHIFQESGSPFFPSFQPAPLSRLSSSMTFLQRIKSTFAYLSFALVLNRFLISSVYYDVVDKYDLDHHLKSTTSNYLDLFLINIDFSVEFPFALMPNVIPVGGLTTRPAGPLDEDLELFMNSSGDEGVIVFTLGTYFSTITTTRPDIVRMFVEALRRLPQRSIMHLKGYPTFEIPDTVKVMPWLPLNDLLGHPKTRLFLTHGGNNAFYESVYHGVPVVAMPLVADQHDVAVRIDANGLGLTINKDNLSSDHIYHQVKEVIQNPKYQANAKRLSAVYRDRPMSAADTAAFWIDHVVKHGSDHLRPPTLDLSFSQIYLLDIAIFVTSVVLVTAFILYRLIRWYCSRKCATKRKIE